MRRSQLLRNQLAYNALNCSFLNHSLKTAKKDKHFPYITSAYDYLNFD